MLKYNSQNESSVKVARPAVGRILRRPGIALAMALLAGCGGGGGGERSENTLPTLQLSDGDVIASGNNVVRIAASDDTGIASVTTRLLRQGVLQECSVELDAALVANTLFEACLSDQPSCVVDFIPEGIEIVVFPPPLYAPVGLEYEVSLVDRDGSATDPVRAVFCFDVGENASPRPAADTFQLVYPTTIQKQGVSFSERCEKQAGSDGLLLNDDDDEHVTNSCLQAELLSEPEFASNAGSFAASFRADGGFRYEAFGDIPPAAANGLSVDRFTYRVSDGVNPPSAPITVEIVFSGENTPPVVQNDSFTVPEDSPSQSLNVLANDSDPDALPLSISGVSNGPVNGLATIRNGVLIDYQPNADFVGTDQFTYTTVDSGGLSVSATVAIQVVAVNDAPAAANDNATTSENTPVVIAVLGNDRDPDGDGLTIQSVAAPVNGTAVANPDGSITYTPDPGFFGIDPFEYTVTDGNGGTDTATAIVDVLFVNLPPTAVSDVLVVAEGGVATLDVLVNDTDADEDALEIVEIGEAVNGTAEIVSASIVRYTPNADFDGTDRFSYSVSDGTVTVTSEVVVTVTAVNGLPVAVDDSVSTSENTPLIIDVLANDSDPDVSASSLGLTIVTAPDNGVAVVVNGSIRYTPSNGFDGRDSLVYRITDDAGASSDANVAITVSDVNSPPAAVADVISTNEDESISIAVLANDTDPERDTLSIVDVGEPRSGTASLAGLNIVYQPAAGFSGEDSFDYQIDDGNGGVSTAMVFVTVSNVNSIPVAVADSVTTGENSSVLIDVLANDSDPDGTTENLVVSIVTAPDNGVATIAGSSINYDPEPGFDGSDTIEYQIADLDGATATALISITITNANSPPVAVNDIASTDVNLPVSINVLTNDREPDGDELSLVITVPPGNGSATLVTADSILYTPAAGFIGTDSFSYQIDDDQGGVATADVLVTVNAVNALPEAIDDEVTTDAGESIDINVLLNDGDANGDSLSVRISVPPVNGDADVLADNRVVYAPQAEFVGTDSFVYLVDDSNGGEATATVTVNVVPVVVPLNGAPVAVADSITANSAEAVVINVLANDSDPDEDLLSVVNAGIPANGVAELLADGTILYTSPTDFTGTDEFQYSISDGNGGEASAIVSVDVIAINNVPVAVADAAIADSGQSIVIDVLANDSDPDEDLLSVVNAGVPANGVAELLADGTILYTSLTDFTGTDEFQYDISDGNGGGVSAIVSVDVVAANNVPVAMADAASTNSGESIVIDVLANDTAADSAIIFVTVSTQPLNGVATVEAGGVIRYTPNADFFGVDGFEYSLNDELGELSQAFVEITVNADVVDTDIARL